MPESDSTPGPWRNGRKVGRTIYGPPDAQNPDGRLIGVMDRPEDARLASAAPDLLEALKIARAGLRWKCTDKDPSAAIRIIDEALNEAKSWPAEWASDRVPCTAVVLLRSGRVLLLHRAADMPHFPGHWCFPGGKDEPGETPEACAVRELREETGLVVTEEDLVRIGKTQTLAEDGRVYVGAVFLVNGGRLPVFYDGKTIVLDEAHDNWGVFSLDAPPAPLHPGAAVVFGWLRGA